MIKSAHKQLPENLVCWPYQHTQADDWAQIWTLSTTTEQAIADIREYEGLNSDVIVQIASAMSPDKTVWMED